MKKSGKSGETTSYYEKMSKKISEAMEKASDAFDRFQETGDSGAKTDFGYYMGQAEKLSKELGKVTKNADKAMSSLEDVASAEPNVEYRGQDGSKKPWQDQWGAVSQSDLMSGYGGDMMRRAAEWMNNAQNDLGAKFQTVDTSKLTGGTQYEQLAEKLKVAENQAESLRSKIESIGSGGDPAVLMRLQTQLDTAEKKAEKLAKQMAAIEDGVGGGASADASAQGMRDTGNAAEQATPKIKNYNNAVKETGKASSFFSKASKFAHGMFDKFGKSFKHHEGFLSKFGKTLKRVMMRMLAMGLIRGVINGIRQGLQLLTKSNAEAATQFGRFSAMAKGVKVALGSAALAALNALAGILFTIASAAIAAANAIARFFAVIGGGGTYFATTMSDSFNDLSDSIGGAGGAAKGLLADFDELNIIGQQGGGGGGGGLSGTGGITSSEETAISHLADLLKAEQFEEAGAYIAEKLGEISSKIDKWFADLDAKDYGTKFSEIVNGFFSDPSTFETVGSAVGDGLNVVIHFFENFINKTKWKKIGESFANSVNGIFDTVDWKGVSRTLSGGVNGVLNLLYFFFTHIKVKKIATDIADALSEAFRETDWQLLGATLMAGILDVLEFATTFVLNLDWASVMRGLWNVVIGALREVLSKPQTLLNILADFVLGVLNSVGGLFIGWVAGIFDILGLVVPRFSGVGDKLVAAWDSSMGTLEESFHRKVDEMCESFGNVGDASEDAASEATTAFEKARKELDSFINKLKSIPKSLATQYTLKVAVAYDDSGLPSNLAGNNRMNLANINILKMASGGLAYGNTFANIGEYPNAKSNPEVVAPLSKLQDILAKSGNNSADVKRQNELLTEQNRLLRIISQKELVVGASAELGQVVKQSQALFGAV